MARRANIDRLLRDWTYDPDAVNVRLAKGEDGREVIHMRVDMGMLQLEASGRPDGTRPHGFDSVFDYLQSRRLNGESFELSERECAEIDREFVQFYHRRVCWLTLRKFERAVADADHTLALMDLSAEHSPDQQWNASHEQYRPFVMFHRIQAAALAELERDSPEGAIHQLNVGMEQIEQLLPRDGEQLADFEEEIISRLADLRESLRAHYNIGKTLHERLQEAVAEEKYELAALLRDELARQQKTGSRARR